MGLFSRATLQWRALIFRPSRFSSSSSFQFADLDVTLTETPSKKPEISELGFGKPFSDHMLEIDWSSTLGWSIPRICPLHDLRLHPSAKVFQYAIGLFEGMKAYRGVDSRVRIFRPMENMHRMNLSAARSALPSFDPVELLKCLKKLVSIDQEWTPYSDKCALYMRPTFIGTEAAIGVSMSLEGKLYVIMGPTGPYFQSTLQPVSLLADPQYVRAWPGGCGNFKMGSNYGPTMYAHRAATQEAQCQQALWLFGDDHQMTEMGTMNLFVYWVNEQGETELITPSLESGLILPGITRKSILELAREWNEFKVTEGYLNMPIFTKALIENRVIEVFGSGTASDVTPVNRIRYLDMDLDINFTDGPNSLTRRIYDELNDIHYFRKPHHWMETVDNEEEY